MVDVNGNLSCQLKILNRTARRPTPQHRRSGARTCTAQSSDDANDRQSLLAQARSTGMPPFLQEIYVRQHNGGIGSFELATLTGLGNVGGEPEA